jgi:hypothetical protein
LILSKTTPLLIDRFNEDVLVGKYKDEEKQKLQIISGCLLPQHGAQEGASLVFYIYIYRERERENVTFAGLLDVQNILFQTLVSTDKLKVIHSVIT